MPKISPFGLDGNQIIQSHSPPLTSKEKGYAPPGYMLNSLLCYAVHAPPDYRQGLQKNDL